MEKGDRDVAKGFRIKSGRNAGAGLRLPEAPPVIGYDSEKFKRRAEVELPLDQASQQLLKERVTDPLKSIATSHGIKLHIAGEEDFAPHFKIAVGDAPPNYPVGDVMKKIYAEDAPLSLATRKLEQELREGEELTLDRLVVAGSVIYLCADRILDEQGELKPTIALIQNAREEIGGIYERYGLSAPSYEDILHVTAARIDGPIPNEQLKPFAVDAYREIGQPLRKNPLSVKISSVVSTTAYDNAMQRGYAFYSKKNDH